MSDLAASRSVYPAPASDQPDRPVTLVAVLGGEQDLRARLLRLRNHARDLATSIGGPFPLGSAEATEVSAPEPMMASLASTQRDNHSLVTEIENVVNALHRTVHGESIKTG